MFDALKNLKKQAQKRHDHTFRSIIALGGMSCRFIMASIARFYLYPPVVVQRPPALGMVLTIPERSKKFRYFMTTFQI